MQEPRSKGFLSGRRCDAHGPRVARERCHGRPLTIVLAMSPYVGTAEVLPSAGTFGRRNGVICCAVILAGTILSACDWNELIGRAYY